MKKFITFLLILAILGGVFYFVPISFPPLNRLILTVLEKRLDADIDCGSMSVKLFNSIEVENIIASGRNGMMITIKKGAFSYNPVSIFTTRRLHVACSLKDVAVLGKASILELITDLLYMDYFKDVVFNDVKGDFFIGINDTITKKLRGRSRQIKFDADGLTRKDNSINLRLSLSVIEDLVDSVSSEIKDTFLKKEGRWYSILVGITGNYKKPSLRLMSENFRLDLTTK